MRQSRIRNVTEIEYTRYSSRSNERVTGSIKAKMFVIAGGAIANPTLTIAAMALRTADRIAKRV